MGVTKSIWFWNELHVHSLVEGERSLKKKEGKSQHIVNILPLLLLIVFTYACLQVHY